MESFVIGFYCMLIAFGIFLLALISSGAIIDIIDIAYQAIKKSTYKGKHFKEGTTL